MQFLYKLSQTWLLQIISLGRVVRAPDFQCQSRNSPGFIPCILQHGWIWGAADEAVLNIVHKKSPKIPFKNFFCISGGSEVVIGHEPQTVIWTSSSKVHWSISGNRDNREKMRYFLCVLFSFAIQFMTKIYLYVILYIIKIENCEFSFFLLPFIWFELTDNNSILYTVDRF